MTSTATNLGGELGSLLRRIRLAVPADIAPADVFDRHIFHVEADIVTWQGLTECLVVHFHRLHLRGDVYRCKGHHHAGPKNTSLHSAHGHSPNA